MTQNNIIATLQDLDYDIFEHNGYDDASVLLKEFKKKNQRVLAIFPDDDTNSQLFDRNAESYGLAIDTFRRSNAIPVASTSSKEGSDKENNPKRGSSHMKALSPVSIAVAPAEQITEVRPALQKSARRDNTSLRRSLFHSERKRIPINELICSTPIAPTARSNSFFHNDPNISEIQLENVEQASPETDFVPVQSIAALENDLREQYQVDQEARNSPKKNLNKSTASRMSKSSSKASAASCSVVVVPMEMSEDLIRTYKNSQIRRLSVSRCDRTDMRPVDMMETPIIRSKAKCDSVLARKLQACEMTDDEEEEENDVGKPPTPKKAPAPKSFSSSSSHKASQRTPQKTPQRTPQKTSQTPQKRTSHAPPQPEQNFRKPDTPKIRDNDSEASFNSSSRQVMPESVIQTFREELQRKTLYNEHSQVQNASTSTTTSQSLRVNIPKKVRSKTPAATVNIEYLNTGKQKSKSKKKKVAEKSNKKRTLYSQESDDENTSPQSSQTSNTTSSASQSVKVIYQNNRETIPSEVEPENCVQTAVKDSEVFRKPRSGPLHTKLKKQKPAKATEDAANIQGTPKSSRAKSFKGTYEDYVLEVPRKSTHHTRNVSEENSSSSREIIYETEEVEIPKKKLGRPSKKQNPQSTAASSKKYQQMEEPSSSATESESSSRSKSQVKSKKSSKHQMVIQEMTTEEESDDRYDSRNQKASQKSNRKSKKSVKHQQEEEETQYESDEEQQVEISNRYGESSRNPSIRLEKSQHEEESQSEQEEEEVPREKNSRNDKSTKRKRIVESDASEDDQSSRKPRRRILDNRNADDDEGFQSDDDDFDVIYVPQNDRYPLRKRRLDKPWFLINAPSNMRVQHAGYTKKEEWATNKIKQMVKEGKITHHQAWRDRFLAPTEKLKMLKTLEKDNKRAKSVQRAFSRPPSERSASTSRDKESTRRVNQMERIEEDTASSSASSINKSTHSEAISTIFSRLQTNQGEEGGERTLFTSDFFQSVQLNSINWVHCPNGISFFGFVTEKGDGLIKIQPGCKKDTAKTKNSQLKFLVLCGEVIFTIREEQTRIKDLGYVVIQPGARYSFENVCQQDSILAFTKQNQGEKR